MYQDNKEKFNSIRCKNAHKRRPMVKAQKMMMMALSMRRSKSMLKSL